MVDLGMAAKVRPCLILSDYPAPDELALVVIVPHPTALRRGVAPLASRTTNAWISTSRTRCRPRARLSMSLGTSRRFNCPTQEASGALSGPAPL